MRQRKYVRFLVDFNKINTSTAHCDMHLHTEGGSATYLKALHTGPQLYQCSGFNKLCEFLASNSAI